MSCFILSDRHIGTLAVAIKEKGGTGYETDAIADILKTENYKSWDARYSDDTENIPAWNGDKVEMRLMGAKNAALALITMARSYDYQSCEHDGWKTSEARGMIDRLVTRLLSDVTVDEYWHVR